MQETLFPLNHKLLSPVYVQPVVDKYIALTYQYLEERADQYNGLNTTLRDFIVFLAFDASGHAFFGKDCPVDDLFKPFKVFDDYFHLLIAGVPKIFLKDAVNSLNELATIIEERFLSKPNALDDASDLIKEYDRIIREDGFVSPPFSIPSAFAYLDGPLNRTPEMLPTSLSLSCGLSRQMHHLRRTGSSPSTSKDRMVSIHWPPKLMKLSPIGIPRTHPSL